MNKQDHVAPVPKIWRNTLLVTLLIAFFFLRSYLMLIVFAALTTYLCAPLYERIYKWTKKTAIAVPVTMVSVLLLILIPLSVVLGITVIETRTMIKDIQSSSFQNSVTNATDSAKGIIQSVNDVLSSSDVDYHLDRQAIITKIQEVVPKILNATLNFLTNTLGSVPRFFTFAIVYLFLLGSMLVHKNRIIAYIKALSPFDDKINTTYFRKIALMTSAMVKGQFVIAVVQGLIGALSLWIAGIDYIFFFAIFLIFMSFIPLGGGIITLPIAGILLLSGNIWQGLLVGLTHLVIVTNIDSLLRIKLVHKDAYLPASLMLLSTFAGVGFFGLIGVVYGPIIMILITTTLELYVTETKSLKSSVAQVTK